MDEQGQRTNHRVPDRAKSTSKANSALVIRGHGWRQSGGKLFEKLPVDKYF
jgi:hypothetical protein